MELNLHINEEKFDNNLDFYTMLKSFIKIQLSNNQLKIFKNYLPQLNMNNFNDNESTVYILRDLVLNKELITKSETKLYEFENFFNILELFIVKRNLNDLDSLKMIQLIIDLFVIKDLITSEAKAISVFDEEIFDEQGNIDYLSLKYDAENLKSPYSQRVAGILIAFKLLDMHHHIFINETTERIVKNIRQNAKNIMDLYQINVDQMYSIIINESINQSIVSSGGQSFEDRIMQKLKLSFGVKEIITGSHDKYDPNVEYDFKFKLENYKIGISAKRTTRERYKQNFENVDNLEVDCLLLITLGVDLNESKLKNILDKKGNFIVVADEIYQNVEYMNKNKRVISSKYFNKENLLKFLNNNL